MKASTNSRELLRLNLAGLVVAALVSVAGWLLVVEHDADYEREQERLATIRSNTQCIEGLLCRPSSAVPSAHEKRIVANQVTASMGLFFRDRY
jgi:hypothetical protein